MKNLNLKFLFLLFQVTLLLCISSAVDAQSLPNVQKQNFLAPSNIKIDGNPIEWGNKYMAHNHISYIFYSMANDADKLYLIVHIKDRYAIQKVLFGGITLTIESPKIKENDRKEDSPNITLKFPIPNDTYVEVQKNFSPFSGPGVFYKEILDTIETSKGKRDSILMVLNRNLENTFKEIEVSGIKEIEEPFLSIYNTDGIKAAARFNQQLEYTCELAIPLKFLSTAINSGAKFKYNIKANGKPTSTKASNGTMAPTPVGVTFGDELPNSTELFVFTATDFSGSYKLVTK